MLANQSTRPGLGSDRKMCVAGFPLPLPPSVIGPNTGSPKAPTKGPHKRGGFNISRLQRGGAG